MDPVPDPILPEKFLGYSRNQTRDLFYDRHARIREHMYTKFRNVRNVGNAIHYWHLKTWAKEAAMLMGIPRFNYSIYFLQQLKRRTVAQN